MAEQPRDHAVRTGVLALVAVGLVVGLLVSGAVLAVTQVLGLGDSGSSSAAPSGGSTMYLPTPTPTPTDDSPQITLAPAPGPGEGVETSAPALTPATTAPAQGITLSALPGAVSPMELITLEGVYPGGDGARLQVERMTGGAWTSFPVTASVQAGGAFSTSVRTAQQGETMFRVVDSATGVASDGVSVTIS